MKYSYRWVYVPWNQSAAAARFTQHKKTQETKNKKPYGFEWKSCQKPLFHYFPF